MSKLQEELATKNAMLILALLKDYPKAIEDYKAYYDKREPGKRIPLISWAIVQNLYKARTRGQIDESMMVLNKMGYAVVREDDKWGVIATDKAILI